MTWAITWALILGFGLSAVVQAVVRKSTIVRLLGDDRPRTLALATGLGAASSSCSYAAVALARSLFRKGASFTAAMAFEIASTNLVVELGVILALLLGWQFTAAEFVGGPVMIVVLAVLFRLVLRGAAAEPARAQAERGIAGSMEGHAAMDMSVQRRRLVRRRLSLADGYTSVSHVFVMEWAAILRDLVIGLLAAGAIAAWVPDTFWQTSSSQATPARRSLGAARRPASWRWSRSCARSATCRWPSCSGTAGSASAAWSRSSSPTCIILPILNIYRKYYGLRMAAFLPGTFYVTWSRPGTSSSWSSAASA